MQRPSRLVKLSLLLSVCFSFLSPAVAGGSLHSLWELHGKHNTVYLLGSIHVLRPSDYPLAPAVLDAYRNSQALVMEVDVSELGSAGVQSEMLASATLPEGKTLPNILGAQRYDKASRLAREVGVEISTFDGFAPWFVAEAISQLQLSQLGFQAESGVEMYFMDKAQTDGKTVSGLETAHDQIALFENMPLDTQAEYLLSSLEEAHELSKEVSSMVSAWQHGDTQWFDDEMKTEFGRDPALYQSVLAGRNRKWIPKIEALLNDDKNYLVIVGTGHLVGQGSVLDLLKKDGVGAIQR